MKLVLPKNFVLVFCLSKIDTFTLFKLNRHERSNREEIKSSPPASRGLYPHQSVIDREPIFDERLVPTKRMRNLPHEQFSPLMGSSSGSLIKTSLCDLA